MHYPSVYKLCKFRYYNSQCTHNRCTILQSKICVNIYTTTINVHTIGALSYVNIDTTTVNVHTIGALSYVNIDNVTVNVHTIGLKAM